MFLQGLSRTLVKFSKTSITLTALVIFLIFSAVVLPGQSAAVDSYSGSTGSPDLSLFYSSHDLYQMAEQYGSAGREAYVHARFSFDLVFPIIYTLFLVTAISWLLGTITSEASQWRMLNLAPILGMLFDFLENITASIVINRYPALSPVSANLAPVFTFLKWVFVGGSFLILFISGLASLFARKKN
jgi:hypothetical protein